MTAAAAQLLSAREACARIAPSWPLDRWIAVNPAWKLTDRPIQEVAELWQRLGDLRLLPAREHWLEAWQAGRIEARDLAQACAELGLDFQPRTLLRHLRNEPQLDRLPLVTHAADAHRPLDRQMAWQLEVVHQISQCCAAYFSHDHQGWRPKTDDGLFACWHGLAGMDRGIGWLMDAPGIHEHLSHVPGRAEDSITADLAFLDLAEKRQSDYCHALLLSVHGWASCCAFQAWEAGLVGGSDDHLLQLLAIRLAWDRLLFEHVLDAPAQQRWRESWALASGAGQIPRADWAWQRASEHAYQRRLLDQLQSTRNETAPEKPALQAMFCIDVRSEPLRRALEAQDNRIQTLGFAGFFGLPISYQTRASRHHSPHLPGLLAPSLLACEPDGPSDTRTVLGRRQRGVLTQATRVGPAMFQLVETLGLGYALKLLQRRAPSVADQRRNALSGPLQLCQHDGGEVSLEQRVGLGAGLIKGAGLGPAFAPWVLICGHEAHSSNNPQDAGLQCGACGGHGGAVNARVAVQLLNDPAVRQGLQQQGIEIPETTRFVAAVHDTTRQRLRLLGDTVDSHIQHWIEQANHSLRAQLRGQFPDPTGNDGDADQLIQRSNDWAQTRPEWGLANNAAFLVAPRQRSRKLDLSGRCFLHDYHAEQDPDGAVLRLIMTAPMVVAHWINFQYFASVCDPYRLGSGNKVLHNVVGGHLGVFEGNGGDLRIGLAMQSVHDGEHWRHEPLRLSVIIEAPRERIQGIIDEEAVVRQLLDNQWLELFCLQGEEVLRYHQGQWHTPALGDNPATTGGL
jgi:hypothetical protein